LDFLPRRREEREGEKATKKTRDEIERIAEVAVDSMVKVHRTLGPGLLESTYQACLAYELRSRGVEVSCEVDLPVRYGEIQVDVGYRIDMLVAECIIVENKSVLTMPPVYEAQLLTYLKLSEHRLGFLVNWNVTLIKDGIKRMVNGL
jgi:GxxExxY protein